MDLSQNLDATLVGSPSYRDLTVASGDLVLTNDASQSAAATDPVTQSVIQTLLIFLGEFFLDTSTGTPWLQRIFVRRADPQEIDAILQDRILSVPGVSVLTQYSSNFNRAARVFSVQFALTTVSGARLSYTLPIGTSV